MNRLRVLASILMLSAAAGGALAQNETAAKAFERINQENASTKLFGNPKVIGACDSGMAVEVEATAGTLGPTGYTTLKLAFDAVNAGTHQGVINIEICASTTEGTTPATLNSTGAGSAVYTALSIRPLVDGLTITGNPITGFGVIQLKGADNVTIDGDNPNTAGTNRDLTINNTNTATAIAGSVIRIATAATVVTSADNNTIRNLVLNGNVTGGNISTITSTAGSSNSSFVIYAGGNGGASAIDAPTAITSVTTNTAPNGTTINNLVISNNAINQAARAIVFNGANATVASTLTISNNVIGAAGSLVGAPPFITPSTTVYTKGIWINGANGIAVSGNSLRNILSYVGTTMTGIELVGAIGTSVNIADNTINGVVQNSATSATKGILISSATGTYTVAANVISNVQSLGGSSGTAGIDLGGTVTSAVVERNRISTIYNRNATTFGASGLIVFSGTAVAVRNNFISDINGVMTGGSASSPTFGINGFRISGGTSHQIHNNTVNLSGALLANGSGVLTSACTIVGTGQTGIDMRNNICANTLTGAVATTSHVSLFLPSGATSAMNLTLNNNDYFSGLDPATQGIAQVGTTFGTISFLASNFNAAAITPATNLRSYTDTLRATTGNDSATIVTDPVLVSASDLHITVGSPAQNTGATIASVTNDIDQQLRPGGAGYDIGADEVDGITPPANDLSATAFIDPANGATKAVNVAFTPQASFTSLGTATQTNVTVRYRIVNASLVDVYNQTATIPSITFNATQNVSFPPATIAVAGSYTIFARAELAGDTVPANDQITGTLQVLAPLAGAYTVGTGGNFTSLTNAGGLFQSANTLGATSNVSVTITSSLTGETGANVLNELPGGFALSIRPAAATTPTVSGSIAGCLIRLNGADNVTIDGSNTVGGTTRDLTFNNTSTSTSSAVLCVSSLGAGLGASNNTLRNLNVLGNDPTQTLTAISLGGLTPGSVGTNNDNNRVENNRIRRAIIGIYNAGASAAIQNSGTVITLNDMTGTGTERVRRAGILVFNENGIQITRNDIGGIDTSESTDAYGIGLGTQTIDGTTTTSGSVTNAVVSRNRINGVAVSLPSDFSAAGIAISGGATGANVISNNMVSGVVSNATPTDMPVGIFVAGATGSVTRLYHNSILMSLDRSNTSTQTPSFGIAITGVDPAVELKNNIIVNSQNAPNGGVGAKNYAIGLVTTTFVNLDANYNEYFASGTNVGFFRSGSLATSAGTDYATLGAWQTAISDDANSVFADPLYVSATDLHIQPTSPAANIGTPIAGVTVDFDGETRSLTTPEIGADELPPPNTAPSITPTAGGLNRQAGSGGSNSTIAVVSDSEQSAGSLVVTAPGVPAGLIVASIVNSTGTVTADVAATCNATVGANTVGLSVSDGLLSTAGNLTVNVSADANPIQGTYGSTSLLTGAGTTVTPSAAPTDNGSVVLLTASAPGFTGVLTGNPATGVITVSNAGPASGTPYLVTVTATDNCDLISTTTFNLTVNAPNTAPSITPAVGVTRQAGSAASNGTIATVSDTEQAAGSLVVTAPGVPAGLSVASIVNTTGTVTADVGATCSATVGTNSVGLSVSDGLLSTADNLSVNVTANTAPTLGTYGASTATAGSGTTVTPGAAPTDNGSVATLTASAPGFTGTFSGNPTTGVITITNAGPASGTPYLVTVTATDNCGSTSFTTFNLTVNALNTPPTITPAVGVTRQAGSTATNSTIATVSDAESSAGSLTVTAPSVPAGLTVSTIVNTNGTVTANLGTTCSATVGANTVGLDVSDGSLNTAGNLSVDVTANTGPVQGTYGATTVASAGSTTVTPSAAPTDNGTIATLTAAAPGFTGTLTGDTTTGVISVSNAGPASVTPYVVTVTATDNCGTPTTRTFNLTVSSTATTLTLSGPATARVSQAVTYTVGLLPAGANGTVTVSSGALNCVITTPTASPSCALTFPTVGVKSVVANFVPADGAFSASTSNTVSTTVNFSANLEVTKTNGVTTYNTVGDLRVYTLVLRNLGPDAAPGVVFTDTVPATLTGASWTCVAANSAACPAANGTGSINATVATLPANGTLTYTLQANVATPLPTSIVNTAQVSTTGLFIDDSVPGNNSATDTDFPEAIFKNGFEDPVALKISTTAGSETLPLAALRSVMDGTARALLSYNDATGEALRLYGRINAAGDVELAIAMSDTDGQLRLGEWNRFTGTQARLSYSARDNGKGLVLHSADLQ